MPKIGDKKPNDPFPVEVRMTIKMATRGATKGISLIKRGWHEIPEVVGSIAMCAFGLASFGLGATMYLRDTESAHQHRYTYTVVRTSDVDPNKKIYN